MDPEQRLADAHPATGPRVLLVRFASVELERHPEPSGVEVAGTAALPGKRCDGSVRHHGQVVHVDTLAGLIAPRESKGNPREPGQDLRPRAGNDVCTDRAAEEVDDESFAEHGSVAFGDAAVGEGHRQALQIGVVNRPDGLQWTEPVGCEPPSFVVHEEEQPILGHADIAQVHLIRMGQGHRLDRSDINPKDGWHRVSLTDHDATVACCRVASNGRRAYHPRRRAGAVSRTSEGEWMDRDRAHDEVVSDLTALQGRLRGVDPLEASEAFDTVTVTEGDVSVRMSAIGDRLSRLEQDLVRVDARIDQELPERYTVVEWRHFPEFNFAPQVFQLTLDDQIALLQGTIAERLEREG